MRMRRLFAWVVNLSWVLLLIGPSGHASAASPEDVALASVDAMKAGQYDDFAKAMHPEALREFRSTMLAVVEAASKAKQSAQVLTIFEGVKSTSDLKKLDDVDFFATFLGGAMKVSPETREALAEMKVQTIGQLPDGKDVAHVVYRTSLPGSGKSIDTVKAVSLRKNGETWGLLLNGDVDEIVLTLKQRVKGNPTMPNFNFAASKVEPLGQLPEGDRKAHVVYRITTPFGSTKVSKIDVLSLADTDAGWKLLKSGKPEELTTLVEERIGIRKLARPELKRGPSAMALATSEFPDLTDAPKSKPKILARASSKRAKPGYARDEVDDLPSSFMGGDRDRFHDVAPKGGVLVGVRVSFTMKFGGRKISSVQPVYRSGEVLREGGVYGQVLSPLTTVVAKPGYAVGSLKTHTGLNVDGFGIIFMKIDENHLDLSDSYNSPWLGDREGGIPKDVESDGSLPVGLQGRAARDVNALGLILLK